MGSIATRLYGSGGGTDTVIYFLILESGSALAFQIRGGLGGRRNQVGNPNILRLVDKSRRGRNV
jgi:hypothetical protein